MFYNQCGFVAIKVDFNKVNNMKKKVLFITPSLCLGGLEHSLINTLKVLNPEKYDMYLYTYRKDMTLFPLVPEYVCITNDILDNRYNRKPIAILLWGISKICGLFSVKQNEKWLIRRKKYTLHQQILQPSKYYRNTGFDVVVANAVGKSAEMATFVKAKKRFVFFRSSVDLHHEENIELFPKYDGIIAVSQGVKDMLCSSYGNIEDKVYVLENYVDAEQIITKANETLPNETYLPANKLILCTCGRFSEEKGFDLAVESANILKKKGIDFIWYFIGDGVLRKSLEKQISEYSLEENIVITGYVNNPFPYIKMCDIYIQPSYHESYGRTIKEAIILGKPIVSTDTVGAHTLLNNTEFGEIVDINANAIAQVIISAVEKQKQGKYDKYDIKENELEKSEYISKLEKLLDS